MWWDPQLIEYNAYAATLRKRHAPPMGPLKPQHMPEYRTKKFGKSGAGAALIYQGVVSVRDDPFATAAPLLAAPAEINAADESSDAEEDVYTAYSHLRTTIVNSQSNGHLPLGIIPSVYEMHVPTAQNPTIIPDLNLNNHAL